MATSRNEMNQLAGTNERRRRRYSSSLHLFASDRVMIACNPPITGVSLAQVLAEPARWRALIVSVIYYIVKCTYFVLRAPTQRHCTLATRDSLSQKPADRTKCCAAQYCVVW